MRSRTHWHTITALIVWPLDHNRHSSKQFAIMLNYKQSTGLTISIDAQILLYISLTYVVYTSFPKNFKKILKMSSDAYLSNRHNGAMVTWHLALRHMREAYSYHNLIHITSIYSISILKELFTEYERINQLC